MDPKGLFSLRIQSGKRKPHRTEDVIPRIRLLASPPRNLALVTLVRRNPAPGRFDLISVQKSHVRPFASFRVSLPRL